MIKNMDFYTNIVLYGKYGTGKTTTGCTAPKPIALIDADNKAKNQANIRNLVDNGEVVIFPMNYPIVAGGDLDFITRPDKVNIIPDGYKKFIETLHHIVYVDKREYATIFIDSGSRVVQHLIQLIISVNNKTQMSQNLWGVFYTEMANRLTRLQLIPANFVWSFQERVVEDESTKQQTVVASIPGQMGEDLGSFFNEVYNTRVQEINNQHIYYLVTRSNAKHSNRTSGNLLLNEKPDLSVIIGKLSGKIVTPPKPVLQEENKPKVASFTPLTKK